MLLGQACNFIKKEALAQVFSCEFCKISKNNFSYITLPVAASEIMCSFCFVITHHKNIQTLATEVFKVVNNICPPIMKTFFDFRENRYNNRKFQEMRQRKLRTVWYGLETALYRAPPLWSLVPADLKSLPNVNPFKSKIKHWECTECSCKHCKTYLYRLYLTFSQNQLNPVIKL